jgi:hypothetical protein
MRHVLLLTVFGAEALRALQQTAPTLRVAAASAIARPQVPRFQGLIPW